ncbi:MAG: hypothetical protein ACKVS9_16685 [Phycisphaerae bacterium]
MFRKLYGALAFVSLAAMLAAGGLGAYLYGTGKLDGGKVEQIAAVLRGEPTSQPVTSQPTSQTASAPITLTAAKSADELRAKHREDQLRRALLERANRDLTAQKQLLDQATQELIARTENFETQKKSWTEEQQKLRDQVRDAGFEAELKYVAKLPARQAKDHLIKTWQKSKPDAVRMLAALNPSAGQRILEQLKTPEEQQILHELLEQLRNQDVEPRTAGTGKAQPEAN